MDDIFVTQPFTARHVRFTKKLGKRHLQQLFIMFMLNFICHLVCPEFYIISVSYAYKLAFALIIH